MSRDLITGIMLMGMCALSFYFGGEFREYQIKAELRAAIVEAFNAQGN